MEAVLKDAHCSEIFDRESLAALSVVMAEDILPNDPTEHRRRNRLYALRAMDRLGLLGEENLIPTLISTPDLRRLADEEGARWVILTELGRIRELVLFEAAVEWVLENRPHTEEAKAQIRRLRVGAIELPGAPGGQGVRHGAGSASSAPNPTRGKSDRASTTLRQIWTLCSLYKLERSGLSATSCRP